MKFVEPAEQFYKQVNEKITPILKGQEFVKQEKTK